MHNDSRKDAEAFIEKVIAPARAARIPDPEAARARSELDREDLELVKRELVEGGLDVERLDKLAAKRSKDRKKLAEENRRKAIEASAAAAGRLADLVAVILPADPVETVIDQVTFIRSFLGQGVVVDSNIGPSDNWARYRVESSTDSGAGTGRLSFFTLWQNQQNTPTIITARANLVVNAHLSCDAEWMGVASWFDIDSEARGSVRARTTVWSMDSSISSIVHDQLIGSAGTTGGFFGDGTSDSIEFSELLTASGVAVPAQAFVLIEVELVTDWHTDLGSVTLDAEGGSHRVDVPSLVLTELRTPEPPPPTPTISIAASVNQATSPPTVTVNWSGALGTLVDIFENGSKGTFTNDGVQNFARNPGTYVFRVCNTGTNQCSTDATVTVT